MLSIHSTMALDSLQIASNATIRVVRDDEIPLVHRTLPPNVRAFRHRSAEVRQCPHQAPVTLGDETSMGRQLARESSIAALRRALRSRIRSASASGNSRQIWIYLTGKSRLGFGAHGNPLQERKASGALRGAGPRQTQARIVSAPETALLTCGEEGLLEGIWRQGGGVETGRQQGFDLGE